MAGVPELMILRLLQRRPMYGYEIVQAIRVDTGDLVSLGEGVVYPVLHTFEREAALKSHRKMVEGHSRVYYALTTAGLKRYRDLAQSWTVLTRASRGLAWSLGDVGHAAPGRPGTHQSPVYAEGQ